MSEAHGALKVAEADSGHDLLTLQLRDSVFQENTMFSRIRKYQTRRRKSEKSFEHEINALRVSFNPDLFLNLPPEIHIYITRFLAWPTITNLRLTCSQLATTITKESLSSIHRRCSAQLLIQESEAAAEIRPRIRRNYDKIKLPCYRCHHWMNSGGNLEDSAFTRAKGTELFDLGGARAGERICVRCGIRSGYYPQGMNMHALGFCLLCRRWRPSLKLNSLRSLSSQGNATKSAKPTQREWVLDAWRYHFRKSGFCEDCLQNDEALLNGLKLQHDRLWGKYEEGLRRGKAYRECKGRRLRAERGIPDPTVPIQYQPRHFCPIMEELRHCSCWKGIKEDFSGRGRWPKL